MARVRERSYPPTVWGGGTGRPATGATAGIPGTWTPPGCTPPGSVPVLMAATPPIVASPSTPWTSGQYVQTRTAGAAGRATWTGTDWVGGAAPLTTGDTGDEEPCPPDEAPAPAPAPAKKAATGK